VARALELLRTRPDWVILDVDLADGSGLAVLHEIRRAKLPARVVVSAATKDVATLAAVAFFSPDLILPNPLDPALLPIVWG
jgi:DNA-binding NarL/FixJ family response regulator